MWLGLVMRVKTGNVNVKDGNQCLPTKSEYFSRYCLVTVTLQEGCRNTSKLIRGAESTQSVSTYLASKNIQLVTTEK